MQDDFPSSFFFFIPRGSSLPSFVLPGKKEVYDILFPKNIIKRIVLSFEKKILDFF